MSSRTLAASMAGAVVAVLAMVGSGWGPASAATPMEQAKLTAADATADDRFGDSVAVAGDTAVVGAPDADGFSGSAYVFTRTGTTWTQQAKLTAADAASGDSFGWSVAVAGDTAVVGAWGDDFDTGSAYVFTRTGTTWTQQAKLTAADAASGDRFGRSVAVAGDTVVVGTPDDDDAGSNSGSAYVFTRTGTTWTQQAKLTADDAFSHDSFGESVAVSGDTVVVGAPDDDHFVSSSGSAYVFTRTGTTWTQQTKLRPLSARLFDSFGSAVAVAGDTAVIGTPGAGSNSGSADVFTRTGTSWTRQTKLTAADASSSDQFGDSVAVAGNVVVVGAYWDDDAGSDSGSAYVFTRTGTTWTQQTKLTAADATAGDEFGESVAVSGDTVVVGAHWDDDAGRDSGSAYVFTVAAPAPPGAPGPPTAVVAIAGDTTATVSWTPPADNGGDPNLTYTATATPGGVTCTATSPTTFCQVTGLTNATPYTFTVTATNSAGTSSPSASSPPITPGLDCTGPLPYPFTDVSPTSFAYNDIGCIYTLGVTTGTSPTTYSPADNVTREQMAAFLARLYRTISGDPCGSTPTRFTDVSPTSFAYNDIGCILDLGVTTGTSPTTYSPADNVTREQMAAFLARLYRTISGDPCGSTPTRFTDVSPTSFAYNDIGCILDLGVTTGTSPTTYSPADNVTREQMAAFLARLYRVLT